jgi:hypothetical protein
MGWLVGGWLGARIGARASRPVRRMSPEPPEPLADVGLHEMLATQALPW